ncbi:UNVERIFIED_CONTAM: hypothetical protein K2H54_040712 [Gekko kuhli]
MQSEASLLCYAYWGALVALVLLLLASALLLVKRALRPQLSVTKPSRQGDPEAALVDALHLLDAMMEKLWRRLQQLEQRRGEHQGPGRG